MQISKSSYQKILKKVRASIKSAQNKITRNKVEMAWKIGKIIDEALPKNHSEAYGKNLVEKLEKDTSINQKVLYKMHSFYQTYPKLPKDDPKLNWSHYRVLSGIKKADERQALEDLTRENSWDSHELQDHKAQASFEKGGGTNSSEFVTEDFGDTNSKPATPKSPSAANAAPPSFSKRAGSIQPSRGKVFTYKITSINGSDKKFFDCGFGVFREVTEKLPKDATMVLVTESGIRKSAVKPQQAYTFKAVLNRIVDGDTIHANIDSGFGTWQEVIIRLAKINCAEGKTDEGKVATEELTKLLNSVPFFILKSLKTDIYNRYVADIFLPQKNQSDLQEIADKGVYLNQLLLDRGVAVPF